MFQLISSEDAVTGMSFPLIFVLPLKSLGEISVTGWGLACRINESGDTIARARSCPCLEFVTTSVAIGSSDAL